MTSSLLKKKKGKIQFGSKRSTVLDWNWLQDSIAVGKLLNQEAHLFHKPATKEYLLCKEPMAYPKHKPVCTRARLIDRVLEPSPVDENAQNAKADTVQLAKLASANLCLVDDCQVDGLKLVRPGSLPSVTSRNKKSTIGNQVRIKIQKLTLLS